MDAKAAVAFEAGKPLGIQTVQLEGPGEGEALVEIKATGICHRDVFTPSGADPERPFPAVLGHEGAGVEVNPAKRALAEKLGMTHVVNSDEVEDDKVQSLVDLTKGGADYSFECIGKVDVMRTALERRHQGWGQSVIIGVAGAGQESSARPFQLDTGRVWRVTAFGGARGRTDVPKIVERYMDGKIDIDDLITHAMPMEDINDTFALMHEGASIRSVVVY